MYRQLIKPNIAINEQAGWCLSYARRVFGRPVVEANAWQAWTNCKYKHTNRNFPKGVSFPVWFDWYGDVGSGRHRYGHVAVVHTDGRVWSSPLVGNGRAWFATVDDLVRAFGGGMKYVGWSEDISGARVIEPVEEVEMVNRDQVNHLVRMYQGKAPTASNIKNWVGKRTWAQVVAELKRSHVTQNRIDRAKKGTLNTVAHLPRDLRENFVAPKPKVVERTTEVIVERPVGEEEAVRGFFGRLMDMVFKK